MTDPRNLTKLVLGTPANYPAEFQSWIQRLIPANPLIQLTANQLPSVDRNHVVGAANEPVFQHGAAFGSGFETPGFHLDPWGIVHLRGLVGPTYSAGQTIWTLPAGYRPILKKVFSSISDTGAARVDVDQNGNVIFVSGGTGYVTLDGISFRNS